MGRTKQKQITNNVELKVGTYKDIKCSTCGILKSQSSNLDNAKVSNNLHKKVAVDQLVGFMVSAVQKRCTYLCKL